MNQKVTNTTCNENFMYPLIYRLKYALIYRLIYALTPGTIFYQCHIVPLIYLYSLRATLLDNSSLTKKSCKKR